MISENTPVFGSLREAVQLARGKGVTIEKKQTIHGGDANDAYRLFLSDGTSLFLKANSISNADFFRAEAEGVAALRDTGAIRVPKIYAIGTDDGYSFLMMEHIERAGAEKEFWENLGIGLASMHRADTTAFVDQGKYGFKTIIILEQGSR